MTTPIPDEATRNEARQAIVSAVRELRVLDVIAAGELMPTAEIDAINDAIRTARVTVTWDDEQAPLEAEVEWLRAELAGERARVLDEVDAVLRAFSDELGAQGTIRSVEQGIGVARALPRVSQLRDTFAPTQGPDHA